MSGRPVVPGPDTLILGIETSCDETAAALVMGGTDVVSSVVSTQIDLHAQYGGVVPEIASRAHLDMLNPIIARAIVEAGVDERRIDRVEAIISSMTLPERARPDIINGSRRRRIAQGSGTTVQEVNQLLAQFKQMQKLMKRMGKGGLPPMLGV
jgi:hypothetical protein